MSNRVAADSRMQARVRRQIMRTTPQDLNRDLMRSRPRVGFTLVELLVVIGIIGLLVALLLPAIQMAREAARKAQCKNNLRQIGVALHSYHDSLSSFPPAMIESSGWAWSALVLPYLEKENLQDEIDFNFKPERPENADVIKVFVDTYVCPSASSPQLCTNFSTIPGVEDVAEANYVCITTHEPVYAASAYANKPPFASGVMSIGSRTRLADVKDGTSTTIMVAEADALQDPVFKRNNSAASNPWCPNGQCHLCRFWCAVNQATTAYGINSRDRQYLDHYLLSHHPGGAHFLFADGHVQFMSEDIEQSALVALTTRKGGEVIDNTAF